MDRTKNISISISLSFVIRSASIEKWNVLITKSVVPRKSRFTEKYYALWTSSNYSVSSFRVLSIERIKIDCWIECAEDSFHTYICRFVVKQRTRANFCIGCLFDAQYMFMSVSIVDASKNRSSGEKISSERQSINCIHVGCNFCQLHDREFCVKHFACSLIERMRFGFLFFCF